MKKKNSLKIIIYIAAFLLSIVVYNFILLIIEMEGIRGTSEIKMIQTFMINIGYNFGLNFAVPYYLKKMYYGIPVITAASFIPTLWLFYGPIGVLYLFMYVFAAAIGTLAAKGYLFKEKTGMV